MDTRKIKKLIELVKETGIGELEVKSGEESVRITTTSPPAPIPTPMMTPPPSTPDIPTVSTEKPAEKPLTEKPKKANLEGHKVKALMVGTVYLAPKPGSPPFVAVGEHVNVGDTLCLIEAMKMFNKIEADQSGVISARLIDNEQPVEYDQPLFIIDTGK